MQPYDLYVTKAAGLLRAKLLSGRLVEADLPSFDVLLNRMAARRSRQAGLPEPLKIDARHFLPSSPAMAHEIGISAEIPGRGKGTWTAKIKPEPELKTKFWTTMAGNMRQGIASRSTAAMDQTFADLGVNHFSTMARDGDPSGPVMTYRRRQGYAGSNTLDPRLEKTVPDTPAVARDRARFK